MLTAQQPDCKANGDGLYTSGVCGCFANRQHRKLPADMDGWNYSVRMYAAKQATYDGTWTSPAANTTHRLDHAEFRSLSSLQLAVVNSIASCHPAVGVIDQDGAQRDFEGSNRCIHSPAEVAGSPLGAVGKKKPGPKFFPAGGGPKGKGGGKFFFFLFFFGPPPSPSNGTSGNAAFEFLTGFAGRGHGFSCRRRATHQSGGPFLRFLGAFSASGMVCCRGRLHGAVQIVAGSTGSARGPDHSRLLQASRGRFRWLRLVVVEPLSGSRTIAQRARWLLRREPEGAPPGFGRAWPAAGGADRFGCGSAGGGPGRQFVWRGCGAHEETGTLDLRSRPEVPGGPPKTTVHRLERTRRLGSSEVLRSRKRGTPC